MRGCRLTGELIKNIVLYSSCVAIHRCFGGRLASIEYYPLYVHGANLG